MNDAQKPLDIHSYLDIARRRKWYIIFPLVLATVASFAVCKYLPKVYKTTTTILVQPQTVPEKYIQPTVTASVIDRLNTISQETLSRTKLEKVIQEFNLYSDLRQKAPMEEIVEKMSKAIEVNVAKGIQGVRIDRAQNAFSISYEGEEPRTVMMVTNKLASLFIEENLKVRELQAENTSNFISKELAVIEEQLIKKEEDLRNFRERHMGQLPQQLDANLRILEGLQQQLKRTSDGIHMAEDRRSILQNQMDLLTKRERPEIRVGGRSIPASGLEDIQDGGIPEEPLIGQYNQLKRELDTARSKYTESHPDVIDLKRRIADLEPRATELAEKRETAREARVKDRRARLEGGLERREPLLPNLDPESERLLAQYKEQNASSLLEAKRLKEEETKLKEQISLYQRRIEDTPRREQEFLLVTRDYDLLKANYQSLLDKKIQSQMAENMERKQQGEQFKILDPARLPEKPIRPDRNKILLMGTLIGLVAGLGMAWFRDSMDQSFYNVAELEDYLKIKVLVEIPNLGKERAKAA